MKWFQDLTTRNKLFVCFGLIFALIVAVIASAYTGINTIRESQDRLYQEDFANLSDLQALRAHQNQMRALMLEAQLLGKRTEQDPLLAQAAERSKQIDRLILNLLVREKNDPKQLSRLEELKSVWQAFAQTKDPEVIPLILAGKIEEARQVTVGVQQGREEKIRAIVALIPDEWLHWEGVDEPPATLREVYGQFLSTRLRHSDIFTKEAQHGREALV